MSNHSVVFNVSKKELCTPTAGFAKLVKRARAQVKVSVNKDEISLPAIDGASLVVFGGPREPFSALEFEALKAFMASGGSVMIMVGEGGENQLHTNVNYFLEELGLCVNSDAVIKTMLQKGEKLLHPKEVVVRKGVLNREIVKFLDLKPDEEPTFVYPHGATLAVQKPAVPLLSTSSMAYPFNRPVVAAMSPPDNAAGRLILVGSTKMFEDTYFEKEHNAQLFDFFLRWLLRDAKTTLNQIDADDPDVTDYHFLPNHAKLAERVRACMEDSEEITKDFTTLFDQALFRFDTRLIPEVVRLYENLGVKHEPLRLIQPTFEIPLPSLTPAVFQPVLRDPMAPALDLFDLDEEFSSETSRLAQLTNKCKPEDLEYYVRECGQIVGIKPGNQVLSAKHILELMFKSIASWKNQEQPQEAPLALPADLGNGANTLQLDDGGDGVAMHDAFNMAEAPIDSNFTAGSTLFMD